jgi:hypothetical protein
MVTDALNGSLLDTQNLSSFSGGTYLVWTISGHVKFTMTKAAGPNSVASGLFFH